MTTIKQPISQWQWRTWAIVLVITGVLAGLIFEALVGRIVSLRPERIQVWLDGLGSWAPLVFILLLATAVVVSPIPSVPLDIAAGLAFGLIGGTIYTLIGIDELAARSGFRALLLMRLLPVFQFDWVSYAAGLTAISFRAFALATFSGMIPPLIGIVAVGATLPTNPLLAGTIFAVLVLGVMIPLVAPWLVQRIRTAQDDTAT